MNENLEIQSSPEIDYSQYVNPEIKNILDFQYMFRAVIEMENITKGEAPITHRCHQVFAFDNIVIKDKNTVRGTVKQPKYGAKCICTANVGLNLFNIVSDKLLSKSIIESQLLVSTYDKDKTIINTPINLKTIKLQYGSKTFVADIDIIPVIKKITNEEFMANKELVIEAMQTSVDKLVTFISTLEANLKIEGGFNVPYIISELEGYVTPLEFSQEDERDLTNEKLVINKYLELGI